MTNRYEPQFFSALRDVFIGVPVEGESGYINLMRIKARYFQEVLEPHLRRKVDEELDRLRHEGLADLLKVREEIFEKLYTFFRRYFNEAGSLGLFFTPYHQSVYERVYTDDRDVMLFWKTARLYYVKTDRLFRSMEVEVGRFRFFFDVSALEHKKANEKRELIYTFRERRPDGAFVLAVAYSERGTRTRVEEIRRAIRDALGLKKHTPEVPSEEDLERAIRTFERQSEVDYFICKDARAFLREQFDIWLFQYLLGRPGEESVEQWSHPRILQLQALKRIAYHAIDLVAAFEDELVKIWNKPKFVLRSGYVITLDRLEDRDPALLDRLLSHPGWAEQVREWQSLGIVEADFAADSLWEEIPEGRRLHPRFRFLPLDTRHFKDLELSILALFDPLDESLDGWLIRSENYQALKTILPKFRHKVQCIHIDPPYNTDTSGFLYVNRFRHSSWLTMMENRIRVALEMLAEKGSLLCHADENEYERLKVLLDDINVPDAGTIIWDKRNPMTARRGIATQHEYILWRSATEKPIYQRNRNIRKMLQKAKEIIAKYGGVTPQAQRVTGNGFSKIQN